MIAVELEHAADFDGWRAAARRLAEAGVDPADVIWRTPGGERDLFGADAPMPEPRADAPALRVSRSFIDLAQRVVCHRDEERFSLLYRLLLRLQQQPKLLEFVTDDDVFRADAMVKAVRRERHKMTAFVRFREVATPDGAAFVAWFEPEHHVVRLTAPFFVDRFASMRWSILTPELCVHWDLEALSFTPGATRDLAPDSDRLEDYWLTYYAHIFNPARLKIAAMKREMPMRYWKNLPESSAILGLIRQATSASEEMIAAPALVAPKRTSKILKQVEAARPVAPHADGLEGLRREAEGCRRCPLWSNATQTVFGEGEPDSEFLFVGEQPGDMEDLAGRPFVGPAGQLFNRALADAGIDRSAAYVTNAVKHFKNEPRGKRRIHKSPNISEINACRWWIEREAELLQPKLTVALGASAVRSLTGESHSVLKTRGQVLTSDFLGDVFVTVHPSYLLRLQGEDERRREYDAFVSDLMKARRLVHG
ncbi:MAG: UdgX family uracil-DNA binding protein [Beijerinckiaceae bacterium]|nr:UdgX family uracil-DNA binding protein [Beijerinckiaceae bacterium]